MRRVLFFGDSNTYGLDPAGGHSGQQYPPEIRWSGIVAKKLEGSWEVIADGRNGRCIPELSYEFEELDALLDSCGELDLFAVMLGTNDYLSQPHPRPEKVAERLRQLLTHVRERMTVKFLVIAPPLMDFTGDRFYKPWSTLDGRLSAAEREVAEEFDADFLDAAAMDLAVYEGDHIHLMSEGHRKLAAYVLAYFKKL